jgi:superfamily II DNA/RNA helicase
MAKANLTLPNGTTVNIEGTAEEVASLLAQFEKAPKKFADSKLTKIKKGRPQQLARLANGREGLQTLLRALVSEDYFKTKRTIGEIRAKLEEQGHIYPIVRISTPLLRLTRDRTLRRFRDGSGWVYVS